MQINLPANAERFISDKLKSGEYATAEDVVLAGLQILARKGDEDFAPGELETLIAEGERSIQEHGTLDGDAAFEARRRRRGTR